MVLHKKQFNISSKGAERHDIKEKHLISKIQSKIVYLHFCHNFLNSFNKMTQQKTTNFLSFLDFLRYLESLK